MRYDLHTHTLHSDGTLTAPELVAHARACGVDALALTDHDSTSGVAEARAAAATCGLTLIPGVEISVTWDGLTVHILGLGIDTRCEPLEQGLTRLRTFRDGRALEIDRRLRKSRVDGALDYVRAHVRGAIFARTHFARFLIERGYVRDMRQAFKRYLGRGAPAYVPGQWATLVDAVGWIRAAGGVAVIAHPGRYGLTHAKLTRLLAEFQEYGGRGIEVVSGNHDPATTARFAGIAVARGLLGSIGSDYHGPGQSRVELGRLPELPRGCAPVWEAF